MARRRSSFSTEMSCGPTAPWGGRRPLRFVSLFIAFRFVCPMERRWSRRKPDQSLPRHLDADTQPRLSSIARSPESLERTRHFDSRFKRPLLASRFRSRGREIFVQTVTRPRHRRRSSFLGNQSHSRPYSPLIWRQVGLAPWVAPSGGMSEALALKWSDVDWLNGTLLIERGHRSLEGWECQDG